MNAEHLPFLYSKSLPMKASLFLSSLLLSLTVGAQTAVVVADSTITSLGLGGTEQVGYAFAKGDVVTIDARAEKKLDRMLVYRYPEAMIGRAKLTKRPRLKFTMTEDAIVVFRFVSDRNGHNSVSYKITRIPASAATQTYNTKVRWEPPTERSGQLIPKRVEE
jgi:hypothetical protein